jgi:hypothetical protein
MLKALCHVDAYGLENFAPLCCRLRDFHVFVGLRARIRENITRYSLDGSNRDRVVGMATRYRLEDSGFEPLSLREIFSLPHPSRPTQPTVQWIPGFLNGVKRCGRDVASRQSSTLCSAEDQTWQFCVFTPNPCLHGMSWGELYLLLMVQVFTRAS